MSFGSVMIKSLPENWYIIVNAVAAVIMGVLSFLLAKTVEKCFETSGEKSLKKANYYLLDTIYTVFIAVISFFPLLGMFGTVAALINIGPVIGTAENTSELMPEFFQALTSTAWGIIGALIFKLANSLMQPYIENQIKKAKDALNI